MIGHVYCINWKIQRDIYQMQEGYNLEPHYFQCHIKKRGLSMKGFHKDELRFFIKSEMIEEE
jgi:hypothetical protein